jgi:hypothetical protein
MKEEKSNPNTKHSLMDSPILDGFNQKYKRDATGTEKDGKKKT